ncbi:UDP-N-acetylmuramoylalanine--D-glutamate ligase [compost metagenome]
MLGKTAPKIEKAVIDEIEKSGYSKDICQIINLSRLEECVDYAKKIAKSGDIVVLSPASASFDLYKNFEERGDHFKGLVEELVQD